jgi:hypothetical protein
LIYVDLYSHYKITWQRDKYQKYKHIYNSFWKEVNKSVFLRNPPGSVMVISVHSNK